MVALASAIFEFDVRMSFLLMYCTKSAGCGSTRGACDSVLIAV